MMKKNVQTVLAETGKKKKIMVWICVHILAVSTGILAGCPDADNHFSETGQAFHEEFSTERFCQ